MKATMITTKGTDVVTKGTDVATKETVAVDTLVDEVATAARVAAGVADTKETDAVVVTKGTDAVVATKETDAVEKWPRSSGGCSARKNENRAA